MSDSRVQDKLLDALNVSDIIRVSVNEYDMDFIPALENLSTLAFVNKQEWITDNVKLEKLMQLAKDTSALMSH